MKLLNIAFKPIKGRNWCCNLKWKPFEQLCSRIKEVITFVFFLCWTWSSSWPINVNRDHIFFWELHSVKKGPHTQDIPMRSCKVEFGTKMLIMISWVASLAWGAPNLVCYNKVISTVKNWWFVVQPTQHTAPWEKEFLLGRNFEMTLYFFRTRWSHEITI